MLNVFYCISSLWNYVCRQGWLLQSVSEVLPNTSAHYSQREMLSFKHGSYSISAQAVTECTLSLDITASNCHLGTPEPT